MPGQPGTTFEYDYAFQQVNKLMAFRLSWKPRKGIYNSLNSRIIQQQFEILVFKPAKASSDAAGELARRNKHRHRTQIRTLGSQ
jgi:hypothetical protein